MTSSGDSQPGKPTGAFPDPSRQRLCCKCRRWCDPTGGSLLVGGSTGSFGALGAVMAAGALISGVNRTQPRFMCQRCARARRRNQIIIWSLFLGLFAIFFLLSYLGILPD